ncbi:MAG: hypothetical protein WC674_03375 [Candidatus Krumholzibacteriia bacterium]
MTVSTRYTPLHISRKPLPEEAYFFMINSLLHSRMEAGFPSNDICFDEDVNVYLASLLTSLIFPRSGDDGARGILPGDASLFEAAESAAGAREKYQIYRRSADSLLISLGIFKNARLKRPDSVPHLAMSDAAHIGRGKSYYAIARAYAAQIHRRNTAVGDVLGKLSDNFERYLGVLSLMGGEHFNIFKQLSDGELFHLDSAPRPAEKSAELTIRYDRFLDLYSSYLENKSTRTKEALIEAVREIRAMDPSFEFDIDARERVSSA